jgi:hypothetical protein
LKFIVLFYKQKRYFIIVGFYSTADKNTTQTSSSHSEDENQTAFARSHLSLVSTKR